MNRYQRQQVQATSQAGQQAGLAESVKARGKADLGTRLQQFSDQMTMMSAQSFQAAGKTAAENDFAAQRKKISDIKADTTIDDQTRQEQLAEAEKMTLDTAWTVYGSAYNNSMEASYSDEISLTAAEKANEAMTLSGGDPEKFKAMYQKYADETVSNAPTASTQALADRVFRKQGASTYGTLYKTKATEYDKLGKANYSNNIKILEDTYKKQYRTGDHTGAAETMVQIQASHSNANAKGWALQPDTDFATHNLQIEGEQESLRDGFENALNDGTAIDLINQFDQASEQGAFNHWKHGDVEKFERELRGQVTEKAKLTITNATEILNSGKDLSRADYAEAEKYLEFASEKDQQEFMIAAEAKDDLEQLATFSLPEQEMLTNQHAAEKTGSIYDIKVAAKANAIVKAKIEQAKTDPISLGVADGLFEATNSIEPGKDNTAIIAERIRQAAIAKENFGTNKKVLTEAEVQQMGMWLANPSTSRTDKMNLIAQVEAAMPGESEIFFRQIEDKGQYVISGASDFVSEGRRDDAEMVLHGQTVIRELYSTEQLKEMDNVIRGHIKNGLFYSGTNDRKKARQTIQAYYASLAEGYGKIDTIDTDLMQEAVEKVLGKQNNQNGMAYFVPYGKDEDFVEDFIADSDIAAFPVIANVPPDRTRDVLERSQLIHLGQGKYRVITTDRKTLYGADGNPYILEVK